MLKKLLKYDFKEFLKMAIPLYVLGLVGAVFHSLLSGLYDGTIELIDISQGIELSIEAIDTPLGTVLSIVVMFLSQAILLGISLILVFVTIWIGLDFYKTVFGKQGYLTHTLPVKTSEIFWSKAIVGNIMALVSTIVVLGLYFIATPGESEVIIVSFRELNDTFGFDLSYVCIAVIAGVIINILVGVLSIYASIALGHLTRYRVIISIVWLAVISNVTSGVICFPPLIYIVLKLLNVDEPSQMIFTEIGHGIMIGNVIAVIVLAILGLITYKIMNKKLNLI